MAGDTLGKGVDGLVQPLSQHISGCLEGSSSRGTWEKVAWQSSGPGYRPEHRNGAGGCGGDLGTEPGPQDKAGGMDGAVHCKKAKSVAG